MKNKCVLFLYLVFFINFSTISITAYKVEDGATVHQHITKESEKVWSDIPDEIKSHLQNDIRTNTPTIVSISQNYNVGDDIITGSAEE